MGRHALITCDEFLLQARAGHGPQDAIIRRSSTTFAPEVGSGRQIRFTFSDPSVGRDGHTITRDAWQLTNYRANPVFLFAHAADEPPIGKVIEIGTIKERLVGVVEYADAETYPFADTVYRLVKGGYLNATSTSWIPLEWKFSQDRNRVGGIDFSRVELLEVSQVPVPALPTALVEARAAGIDTGPLYAWAERLLDSNQSIEWGDEPELIALRKAARMPTKPISGRGARAPSAKDQADLDARLAGVPTPKNKRFTNPHLPDELIPDDDPSPVTVLVRQVRDAIATAPPALQRGLYTAGWFLMLLDDLFMGAKAIAQEEAREGDPSPAPAAILAAANDLAQAVLGYVAEQVSEAGGGENDDELDGAYMMAAPQAERRAMLPRLLRALEGKPPGKLQETHIVRVSLEGSRKITEALDRAGRVLSAENEADARASIDLLTQAGNLINGIIDRAAAPAPEVEVEEPGEPDELEAGLARAKELVAELRKDAA